MLVFKCVLGIVIDGVPTNIASRKEFPPPKCKGSNSTFTHLHKEINSNKEWDVGNCIFFLSMYALNLFAIIHLCTFNISVVHCKINQMSSNNVRFNPIRQNQTDFAKIPQIYNKSR